MNDSRVAKAGDGSYHEVPPDMTYEQWYNKHVMNNEHENIHEKALPGWGKAYIPDNKIIGYVLNPMHPDGGPKAVAFEQALGYTKDNYQELKDNIIKNLPRYEAIARRADQYGQRYEIVMNLTGVNGKRANVLTAWIVIPDSNAPRLVSLYITDKKVN